MTERRVPWTPGQVRMTERSALWTPGQGTGWRRGWLLDSGSGPVPVTKTLQQYDENITKAAPGVVPYPTDVVTLKCQQKTLRSGYRASQATREDSIMNRLGLSIAAFAIFGLVAATANTSSAAGKLTYYCSAEIEWCQLMAKEFEKATGIKVAMTRKSSGETFAQIRAERRNPKGDVWWGGTGDPHLQAAEEGMTQVYKSPRLGELQDWRGAKPSRPVTARSASMPALSASLQQRALEEAQAGGTEMLAGPDQARLQGPRSDGQSQLLRHRLYHAGHHRSGVWRGQGLRVHEGPA